MSVDQNSINDILEKDVHGSDGEKIGEVGQVFLDDVTGKPEWVTVKTGLFGTKETFVPISQAELNADGLVVHYDKDTVKGAPNVEVDGGHLSVEEEAELYRHYGLRTPDSNRVDDGSNERRQADNVDETTVGGPNHTSGHITDDTAEGRDTSGHISDGTSQGHDRSRPTTDDAMTLSEDRLSVDSRTEETSRARLRKYVVTEEQTVTVPVRKEKLVVEREPITDTNRDRTGAGAEISEEEVEIILHDERHVVQKDTDEVHPPADHLTSPSPACVLASAASGPARGTPWQPGKGTLMSTSFGSNRYGGLKVRGPGIRGRKASDNGSPTTQMTCSTRSTMS